MRDLMQQQQQQMDPEQNENVEEEDSSFMTLASQWAQNTGMHGLPNITKTKSKAKKVFWTLLLVSGLGIMLTQIIMILIKYSEFPISVSRGSKVNMPQDFPAVTICNRNPARRSIVASTMSMIRTRKKRSTSNGTETEEKMDKKYGTMLGDIYKGMSNITMSAGSICPRTGRRFMFLDYYNTLRDNWKSRIGYKLDTMMVECLFGGMYCTTKNFTQFLHPLYGNCFTFNAHMEGRAKVLQPGPQNGLTLTLYIDQSEYIGSVANAAGVMIVVHEPQKQPFPEDHAIYAATQLETFVALERTLYLRQQSPYPEQCRADSVPLTPDINQYSQSTVFALPNVTYSQESCIKTCIQRTVIKDCNCTSPNIPRPENTTHRICWYSYNASTASIAPNAVCALHTEMQAFATCQQSCSVECREYQYDKSISVLRWPSTSFISEAKSLIGMLNNEVSRSFNQSKDKDEFLRENFAKVNIYYSDANLRTVISSPLYELMQLVSDIGGQVGLWLGLSVLTVFEVVEMLGDFSMLAAAKTSSKNRQKWRSAMPAARLMTKIKPVAEAQSTQPAATELTKVAL